MIFFCLWIAGLSPAIHKNLCVSAGSVREKDFVLFLCMGLCLKRFLMLLPTKRNGLSKKELPTVYRPDQWIIKLETRE
jgi:hypothetical protein